MIHVLLQKETAAFSIARGRALPLDLATVRQEQYRCMSFVLVAWGIVADVDFESERFRWMGGSMRKRWGNKISHFVFFLFSL